MAAVDEADVPRIALLSEEEAAAVEEETTFRGLGEWKSWFLVSKPIFAYLFAFVAGYECSSCACLSMLSMYVCLGRTFTLILLLMRLAKLVPKITSWEESNENRLSST